LAPFVAVDDKRSHAYAEVVLHHVGVEVEPGDVERSIVFWELLGFQRVEPPAALARFTWLEGGGTQIHLLPTEPPTVPSAGHVAVVAPDFERAVAGLTEAGFQVSRRSEYWGAPRAKVVAPGGHTVELMSAPPEPAE
jgi:catechol 2,3-dioxygenase-like lactoylglutathione lyase family enzyme